MKSQLNILLLGNGGRESAIAWKLMQSSRTANLYVAPGNGSIYGQPVMLNPLDFESVKLFCEENQVDMIIVGPEQPLVEGISDYFAPYPIKVIGPTASGARMEGSKEFAKEFMARHAIPTARFMTVTSSTMEEGLGFIDSLTAPYVLKADGLAGGKGVLILQSAADAKDALADMLGGMFGQASSTVVIEEFLSGIECSVFVATDGEDYKILPVAKDYKRAGEGDTGLNTGGMGSVSPVAFADDEFMCKVEERIVRPTLNGLREEGIDYRGFLFIGLMNVDGNPMVVEYNVRLGDPETEVVMPRISSDLVDILEGIADRTLGLKKIEIDPRAVVSVMIVSEGYPGKYEKGKAMSGLKDTENVLLFHAGTKRDGEGMLFSDGGRVLAVTAYGATVAEAAAKAKQEASKIKFEGARFRHDIALDLID